MATKKVRRTGNPRPDRDSKKRTGPITLTLRMDVSELNMIRNAARARKPKQSMNHWCITHLTNLAYKELTTPPTEGE